MLLVSVTSFFRVYFSSSFFFSISPLASSCEFVERWGREGKGGRRDDVLVGRFVEKDLSSGVNIVGVGVWSSPAS